MDATQALQLLLQAAQMANMPATAHQQCVQAFQVLTEALKLAVEKDSKK